MPQQKSSKKAGKGSRVGRKSKSPAQARYNARQHYTPQSRPRRHHKRWIPAAQRGKPKSELVWNV